MSLLSDQDSIRVDTGACLRSQPVHVTGPCEAENRPCFSDAG